DNGCIVFVFRRTVKRGKATLSPSFDHRNGCRGYFSEWSFASISSCGFAGSLEFGPPRRASTACDVPPRRWSAAPAAWGGHASHCKGRGSMYNVFLAAALGSTAGAPTCCGCWGCGWAASCGHYVPYYGGAAYWPAYGAYPAMPPYYGWGI